MEASTRRALRPALLVLGVLGVVALVLLAAHTPGPLPAKPPTVRVTDAPTVGTPPPAGHPNPAWAWVWLGGLLTLAAVLLTFALRYGVLFARDDGGEQLPDEDPDIRRAADSALHSERDDALAAARTALVAGAPAREVIIACWVRLEAAAEQAGRGRDAAETTSEFAGRLDAVDPAALRVLGGLYREARFSSHPLTADDRRAALTALDRLVDVRARAETPA